MKVLVACEFSGIVRDSFSARGHDAWWCDLLPTERPGQHIQGDVIYYTTSEVWDLIIAHPPCTYLAVSGARWWKGRDRERREAEMFFMKLYNGLGKRICIENPIGYMNTNFRKPDQIIQPYDFGHMESKATCLWLRNLPLLKPTKRVRSAMLDLPLKERNRVHYEPPGPDRWKNRSRTLQGIADAMADQWGAL